MSDKLPLCACGEFYQDHHPECPARREYERVVAMRKRDLAEYNRASAELEQARNIEAAAKSLLIAHAADVVTDGHWDTLARCCGMPETTKVCTHPAHQASNLVPCPDCGTTGPLHRVTEKGEACHGEPGEVRCSGCLGATVHHTCGKEPDADKRAQALQDLADNDADLIDWGEKPPCDCCERLEGQWVQYCYCQNSGDLAGAQAWCTARNLTEKNSG